MLRHSFWANVQWRAVAGDLASLEVARAMTGRAETMARAGQIRPGIDPWNPSQESVPGIHPVNPTCTLWLNMRRSQYRHRPWGNYWINKHWIEKQRSGR